MTKLPIFGKKFLAKRVLKLRLLRLVAKPMVINAVLILVNVYFFTTIKKIGGVAMAVSLRRRSVTHVDLIAKYFMILANKITPKVLA